MIKILALDFESSISKTIHGPTFRCKDNDIFTQIWASRPDDVTVVHKLEGFNRKFLPEVTDCDLLIGHNISFDLCYVWDDKKLQDFLLRGGRIWDTQLAEYILTAQQHTTASLAELQEKYLGEKEKPSRISALFKKGIGADKILAARTRCPRLFKLYDYYCHTDGSTPLKIFKAQYIRAKQQNMLPIVELYNDYLLSIINMTCTGVKIDVIGAEKLLREYTIKHLQYLKEAQDILKSVWTDERLPEFNINSPDHKSAVLFGGKIKVMETRVVGYYQNGNIKTKKHEVYLQVPGYGLSTALTRPAKKEGLYSTDEKVLSAIKNCPKTPTQVLEYCKLQELSMKYKKAAKTYCAAFIERSDENNMLFPNFNNTITPTGRISSSEPNLQNIPSKGDLAKDLMGLLVAPSGWVCVAADFSQLEKWIQALVTQDQNLQNALQQGICLHCMTLSKIEGKDYEWVYQKAKVEQDPMWDKKRTMIKPVGFRMDYGGMPKSVAEATGMNLSDVEEIYRVDKEMYPDKHAFFEQKLPQAVANSSTFSRAANIAASKRRGKDGMQVFGKVELLPIFDKMGNVNYTKQEFRRVGYWQTNYGKKYHFTDTGRMVQGNIKRSFSLPKFKNYPNQGGGADIQGATTAELLPMLLKKKDKIRMINEIHDSKLFYVREDCLKPVIEWLKETIEDVPTIFKRRFNVNIPFKIPIEIKIGKNFGDMTVYKTGE
jgi:DNA polymerase I-like protein with 3'-5' exonuclease and polymerase domains